MQTDHLNPAPQLALADTAVKPPRFAAIGAVVGGLAALSCCVMPLVFVTIGVSGAWIGSLTALSPYQPMFIGAALAMVGYGHWAGYQARKACANGRECGRPLPRRLVNAGLWTGTAFVAIALAVNVVGPYV